MKYEEEQTVEQEQKVEQVSQEPEGFKKIIQLILDDPDNTPKIHYTEELSLSEVIGGLELAKETLKAIHVQDKLKKRRILAAYNDI